MLFAADESPAECMVVAVYQRDVDRLYVANLEPGAGLTGIDPVGVSADA